MAAMKHLLHAALALLAVLLCPSCNVMGYGKPRYQISMHLMGSPSDSPREVLQIPFQGQQLTFKKVPEFSQRAIAAFAPFPADDGAGNGLVLKLDAHGRNQLDTATRLHQGELMLSVVNGVPVDVVQVDTPISDGRYTIWRGVSDETIKHMDKKLPRISGLQSSSRHFEMTPSTEKEKREARRAALDEQKRLDALARRVERGEDVSQPPRSKEIPLE